MYRVEGYSIAGCERMENRLREIEAVDYSSRMSFKNGTARPVTLFVRCCSDGQQALQRKGIADKSCHSEPAQPQQLASDIQGGGRTDRAFSAVIVG